MARALADRAGAAAGLGLKALCGGPFPDDGLLDDEVRDVQIVVILCIGDGAGERFANEPGGLFGDKAEQVQGIRGWKSLNFPRNLARLKGGDPRKTVCRSNLHCS